jgi:hypothetical protein
MPYTCLEPVSPSTGQHLVDANDVERVQPNSNMKAIFAIIFYHVLVGTNKDSLQGFRGELLIHQTPCATKWEFVHFAFFHPRSKMRILASAKAQFWVWFFLQDW